MLVVGVGRPENSQVEIRHTEPVMTFRGGQLGHGWVRSARALFRLVTTISMQRVLALCASLHGAAGRSRFSPHCTHQFAARRGGCHKLLRLLLLGRCLLRRLLLLLLLLVPLSAARGASRRTPGAGHSGGGPPPFFSPVACALVVCRHSTHCCCAAAVPFACEIEQMDDG